MCTGANIYRCVFVIYMCMPEINSYIYELKYIVMADNSSKKMWLEQYCVINVNGFVKR